MMTTYTLQEQRKLLLHLKCLLWCLHQMQTRYNLNLTLYSLEHRILHSEIADSNLGDNLRFLIDHLDAMDLLRLGDSMRHLPESHAIVEIGEKHFEIGHYVQSLSDFGPIARGSYGVITAVTPQLRGLFLLDGHHLLESCFAPSQVRTIYGTYVI